MKKTLAALLLLALLLPCAALAEECITVRVSISDDTGALTLPYASVNVTDADGDGLLTISDALACAHIVHHPDGAAAFLAEKTEWGISMYRLWGVENGGSYGYYRNDVSPMSLLDPAVPGDHIKAYAFTDLMNYSDIYSFFAQPAASAKAHEALELTLYANGYDANWAPVVLPVADAIITVNGEKTAYITDAEGCAALTFDEVGEYVLSAVHDGMTLVPPVCIVTVTE